MEANTSKPGKDDLHSKQGNLLALNAELKKAVEFHQAGQLEAAEGLYLKILDHDPEHPDALHLLGVIAHQGKDNDEAENLISQAIRIAPGNPYYFNNLGTVFKAKGKLTEALGCYKKAIQLNSDYLEAYCNLAHTFHMLKEVKKAVDYYQKSIQLSSDYFEAHFNLAIVYHEQGFFEDAICYYQKAIDLRPKFYKTYYYIGSAFHDQGKLEDANLYYRKAVELKPDFFEAYNSMGAAWQGLKKNGKALSCFQKALVLMPNSDAVYVNKGNVYQDQGRYAKALNCYRNALEIRPSNAVAHFNMGISLMSMGKSEKAKSCYQRALEINPEYAKACSCLVGQLQQDCAWKDLKHWAKKLDNLTKRAMDKREKPAETPFLNITRHADPALNHTVAKMWCREVPRQVVTGQRFFSFSNRLAGNCKITIGYLSNNFRNHPTAHLIHDLFELHNRARFNIYCYSYGKNDGSNYRGRIQHKCDRFVELRKLSHIKSAEKIFKDKVDILVDLAGHTEDNRLEICALRPAPVQVRYLGMPGTTGADYFDYIITDLIVTPKEHAPLYSEKFVYLPHCYQINSSRKLLPDHSFNRKKFGLPKNRFVFCSFNTSYKIDPVMFDVWMRILKRVPGSILWLLKGNESVERNLRQEAESRILDPDRLVFAAKLPKNEHLIRLLSADLALDTRIVNGAITTSDALWSGVPVVTLQGNHFASRMSSSILSAVGLTEMVTSSLDQYESLAVRLAANPLELKRVKEKLRNNQKIKPLFDTSHFVKQLEKAYDIMLEIFQVDDEPRHIEVKETE